MLYAKAIIFLDPAYQQWHEGFAAYPLTPDLAARLIY